MPYQLPPVTALTDAQEIAALFDRAWNESLADPKHWEFPADIEADLLELTEGECFLSEWDAYVLEREAVADRIAA